MAPSGSVQAASASARASPKSAILSRRVGVEQEVGWLDVAVDQPAPVRVVEPGRGLGADLGGLLRGEQHAGVVDLAERASGQVLEHQVGLPILLTPVVDPQDVRVVERGHGLRLGPEALEEGAVAGKSRMEHLDGNLAVKGDVVGEVDVRGRTGPQGRNESVPVAEDTSDGVGEARHDPLRG